MPAWHDLIKGLPGGKPAKRATARKSIVKPPPKAYVTGEANRAEVIKAAMAVYRSRRGEARVLLDRALKEMREKPPKTVSEHDKLVRLLTLHRAHVGLKALMSHDLRQYLVLAGIRGLLEEAPGKSASAKTSGGAQTGKRGRRIISKR